MNKSQQEEIITLASHANMGIARINVNGIFEIVNQQYSDITGYSKDELIGTSVRTILSTQNQTRFDILFTELANGIRKSFGIQVPFTLKNGSIKWAFFSATLSHSETDEQPHIVCIIHDVSEQKNREEQDKLSSMAFSHSGDGIMITDAEHTIIQVNPAFGKISGFNENEIVGRKPFLLRSGEHDESFYNRIWKTLELDGIWQGEICYRHKSGNLFYVWETISAVTDQDGNLLHYISILADITEIKERQKVLNDLANYDSLTELPNRYFLEAKITQATEMAKLRDDKVALLFLDLNKFKPINDQYGHKAGDILLMEIAHRLSLCIRQEDTAARIGGDEFVILMPRINRISVVEGIAKRIHQSIQTPISINDNLEVCVSSSIGISIFPDDLDMIQDDTSYEHLSNESEVIELADHAMYAAKVNQLDICFFHQSKELSNTSTK
ncbi:diguanylate cyclase domain-containing protein [Aliikangiella sp. IMCC44359]|uniref:diguanylate cyclase domain-containing protein n=1 Tax=Aliikangiella sp. IMCC44359 TaxID=3459125 RepID=UPI00403AA50A